MDAPYFRVRQLEAEFLIDGLTSCRLGHKIESSGNKKPDGIFVEWFWDGKQLVVHNDRYGFFPLYYFVRPGEFALSTSIPKLVELGAPVALDEAGLSVFLRLGFFIGGDTPFKAIRAIPPCTVFEWENDGLSILPEWPIAKACHATRNSAIDSYIALFKQSIQRRKPNDDNFAIPLSGGRDSRHILLELCTTNHRPKFCITARSFPTTRSSDPEISQHLASVLNLRHIVLEQPLSRLNAELRKNILTNFCSDEHAWYLVIADYLSGRTNAVYDGIGGDVLSAGLFLERDLLELFDAGHFSRLANSLFSIEEQALNNMLPRKEYHRFNLDLAISHLSKELERHAGAPNPVGAFFFANRTRREISLSPYCLLTDVGTIFSPFLDHDLYDFLSSLPASMFLDHSFHTNAIRQAYPSYSHIPYAEELEPLRDRRYSRRFVLELSRYIYQTSSLKFVRKSFLSPRLVRCLFDNKYALELEWFGPLAAYLTQLQKLCQQDATRSKDEYHIEKARAV